jgi:hypothetical protein
MHFWKIMGIPRPKYSIFYYYFQLLFGGLCFLVKKKLKFPFRSEIFMSKWLTKYSECHAGIRFEEKKFQEKGTGKKHEKLFFHSAHKSGSESNLFRCTFF